MAEGKPPYSQYSFMRVIFMIPSHPPPQLSEPNKWSKKFHDFISRCLQKNPNHRATASELLQDPFLNCTIDAAVLTPLIENAKELIKLHGRKHFLDKYLLTKHNNNIIHSIKLLLIFKKDLMKNKRKRKKERKKKLLKNHKLNQQ